MKDTLGAGARSRGRPGKLGAPALETDFGSIRGFPAISGCRGRGGGALGKRPRRSPVEGRGGVSGGKAQAQISPGEGFDCFLRESSVILASSVMQAAAFFGFQ